MTKRKEKDKADKLLHLLLCLCHELEVLDLKIAEGNLNCRDKYKKQRQELAKKFKETEQELIATLKEEQT